MMQVARQRPRPQPRSRAPQTLQTAPPTTPPWFSSSFFVAAPPTPTESAKPSLDNNQNNSKSPSRNSLRSSRDSLASSRPAPPSPAGSRRTSAVLSRHSSTRSRPGASLAPANNHDAEEASPTTPTPTQSQSQQQGQLQQEAARRTPSSSAVAAPSPAPSPASTPMIPVKIRDFAFPDEDVRHAGTGPLTPRPNRRLQRPLSTWSASSTSSASEEHDDGTSSAGGANLGMDFSKVGDSVDSVGSKVRAVALVAVLALAPTMLLAVDRVSATLRGTSPRR